MKREKDIISLPILNKNEGKKIATIKEVIYSKTKFKILAFLVVEGNLFSHTKVISFKNIDCIGKDAVMVKNDLIVDEAETYPELKELMNEKRKIIGAEVLTEDGESLGVISDTVFDENSGKIYGFVLSNGVFQDIKNGRDILPYIRGITFGEEVLIVPNNIRDTFDKNKECFKKLLELH